jgi:hypothetical protein
LLTSQSGWAGEGTHPIPQICAAVIWAPANTYQPQLIVSVLGLQRLPATVLISDTKGSTHDAGSQWEWPHTHGWMVADKEQSIM